MADTLSDRLRKTANGIELLIGQATATEVREAAAELDRREAIVAAAEAWAKAIHARQAVNWQRDGQATVDAAEREIEACRFALLALLPREPR